MSGHFRMERGWMEHKFFGREPFTRAQAWCWLIEKAAWKDRNQSAGKDYVRVKRSEYATSVRFLAERWQWSKSRVQRFLAGLESEGMAERRVIDACSKSGTASGTPLTVITICNYDEYQAPLDEGGTPSGTAAGQQRDSSGTNYKKGKKGKKDKEKKKYVFAGKVIHLTEKDFTKWQETYHGIPDIKTELAGIDDWCDRKWPEGDPRRKDYWHPVKGMLNKKHQELLAKKQHDPDAEYFKELEDGVIH